MENIEIDFVIPWVDGADPKWQNEFKKYHHDVKGCDSRFERYRDWDILKYWFRGVEENAPWARKIFFITWGHLPEWLDVNHPKLVIVNHKDYIPEEYLPTFSANPIEVNLHRIEGLSEHFVYFNDDMFLLNYSKPSDFFKNGLPCEMVVEHPILAEEPVMCGIHHNNTNILNAHFDKRKVIKQNILKWFNLKYRKLSVCNLIFTPWWKFVGFYCHHFSRPYLKSTFEEVWNKCGKELDNTSKNKFRSITDVNQYLFSNWQLCSGKFSPYYINNKARFIDGVNFESKESFELISKRQVLQVCVNDGSYDETKFEDIKKGLQDAFQIAFPRKSKFEV